MPPFSTKYFVFCGIYATFAQTFRLMDRSKSSITMVPEGGLGNRMHAVAAAVRLAGAIGAELDIIWFQDWGLGCRFDELFVPLDPGQGTVREATLWDRILRDRPRRKNFCIPWLFERMLFDKQMGGREATRCRHAGFDFRSWCQGHRVWISSYDYFDAEQIPADAFSIFRPNARVERQIEQTAARFAPRTIGVHIRRTDAVQSISESPTSLFIERMKQEPADTTFYVATDDETEKSTLRSVFGDRIITSARKADRGSVDGMQHALTEMFLLARTNLILGSAHSSFSTTASLIGGTRLEIVKQKE